jgi:quinol monooxygenase YgiN
MLASGADDTGPAILPHMEAHYGLHVHIDATPGNGDQLEALLREAGDALDTNADCLLYLVSRSPEPSDAVFVTELWTSKEAHDASLRDERTREQISRGRPLIASFESDELRPVGGKAGVRSQT